MNELPQNTPPEPGHSHTRPLLLTVLCFLTFIGSGLNFFSSILVAAFYPTFMAMAESLMKSLNLPGMDMLLNAKRSFFLASAFFYLLSATGAVQMWKLKKNGFHIYTIAQILLIISPMYFMKLPGPSLFDVILSGVFVLLYSLNLKYMS